MKVRFLLYRLLALFTVVVLLSTEFAPVIQAYAAARTEARVAAERAANVPGAAQDSTATLSYAATETLFIQAFNAYINTPADAPASILLERKAAVEQAAQLLQAAAERERTRSNATDSADNRDTVPAESTARENLPFIWTSNSDADTGWTVVGRPEGDRETFERAFQTYVSGKAVATDQVPAYDLRTLPAQSQSFAMCQATAASPAGEFMPARPETPRHSASPAQQRPLSEPSYQSEIINTRPSKNFEVTTTAIDVLQDCDPDAGKGEWYFWVEVNGDRYWWENQAWGDVEPAYPITHTWSLVVEETDTIDLTTGGFEDDNDNGVFDEGDDTIPSISVSYDNSPFSNWGLGPNYEPQTHVRHAVDQASSCEYYLYYTIEALPPYFADLSLTMSGPSTIAAGDTMNFRFTAQNAGPFDIGGDTSTSWANLIVDFPEGTTNINAPLCTVDGLRATCRIDSIPVGGTVTMDIQADAPMRPGEDVVTQARLAVPISTDREDPGYGNNNASVTTRILPLADVYVDTTASRAVTAIPGESTTYQVQATVGNNGPTYAPSAYFALTPPGNTTVVDLSASAGSCNPSTGRCDLGDLDVGQTVSIIATLSVAPGGQEGDILNASARVGSSANDPDSSNNSASAATTVTWWDTHIGATGPGGTVYAAAAVNGIFYAGGTFGVRRWNGTNWEAVGAGGPSGTVYALIPDGQGGLYAGGDFTNIGPRLAHWSGGTWNSVGGGLPGGTVYALALLGSDLYVGGQFDRTSTLTGTNNIALWDGSDWQKVGLAGISSGYGPIQPVVRALATDGNKLYVGGTFSAPAANVVAWDPASALWEPLGGGVDFSGIGEATVRALAVLGGRLYVGGTFTSVDEGALETQAIAAWDINAARWLPVGGGLTGSGIVSVNALAVPDGELVAGGVFAGSDGVVAKRIAKWNGATWTSLGQGINDGAVNALAVNNNQVYVGGNFTGVDGTTGPTTPLVTAHNVARYYYPFTDLTLTLTPSTATPTSGTDYRYALTVRSQRGDAKSVAARLELPDGVSFVSGTNCQDTGASGVVCQLGDLAEGASASANVNVHLAREVRGELQARAWAGAYQQEQQPADNAAVSTVTAIAQAGLHVALNGPSSGTAGESISYQAVVTNDGPALAFNAVLTFTFSGGVATLNAVSGLTCTPVENYDDRVTVACPLGDMLPGESASGQFDFTIGPATRGTLQGLLIASSGSDDPNTADNRATVDTVVTTDADVQVALDAPTVLYLLPGHAQELHYRLRVMHGGGPSLARDVVLTQTLPSEVLFASADSGCAYEAATHQVVCTVGQLDLDAQAEFAVRVAVSANVAHGSVLEAQLTASSDVTESDPANNTTTAQTRITTDAADAKANLKLTQVVGPAVAGTTLFYTLTVYNQGAVPAQSFTITDTLPGGVTFDMAYSDPACDETAPGTARCALGALEVGQSRQVVVAARVPYSLADGTQLTNQAEVRGEPGDGDLSDNVSTATATVTTAADLRLEQSSSHRNPTAGELITFTLTIGNRGPSMARGVELSNTPPVGLVLQKAIPSQGSCDTTEGVAVCSLGSLRPLGTATVELVMTAGAGTVTNTVQVSALTPDPRPDNNTADTMVKIEGGAPSTRTFGAVTVNANAFIALPNGDLQAFGDVWIGEHYYLAETTDSIIIHPDGNHFEGEGTLAMREGEYPLFTGHFNGVFSDAGDGGAYLYPENDVAYHLTGIGDFEFDPAQSDLSIRIDLVSGQAHGGSVQIIARPRGMALVIPIGSFSIWPGPVFEASVEPFSFELAGFTTNVEAAEFRPDGIYATTTEITLPESWGGLVAETGELRITPDDLSSTVATFPLPNLYLAGDPVTTCASPTGNTTVAVLDNSVSLIYAGGGFSFLGKGQLCVVVPDNVVDTPVSFIIDTNGNFRAQADIIELNIATARLTMKEIAIGNDGLSVDVATLEMPPNLMAATVTLQDVAINADGLQVGGGALSVTMPDFGIGDTVRFEQPILTIKVEGFGTPSPRYAFAIDTTLRLNLPQNAQQLRVTAEIDTSGQFQGTVEGLSLAIASARLDIPRMEISNDGLFADEAVLTLPPSLGGVSGKLAKIRIDRHGLTVGGGGVAVPMPDVNVAGFSVTDVLAEFEIAEDRTFKLKVSGTMQIDVKNMSAMASGWFSVDSRGRMTGAIDSFSLVVAGLEMSLKDARIMGDTLFFAEASLKVPPQWGGMSVAVYNVRISSSGIRIGGGRFEVPTIRVGSITIGGLYGELREEGDGYVIGAGGTFMVPGLGGPAGCGLKVGLVIYVNGSGSTVAQIYPAEERPDLAALAPTSVNAATGFALREVNVGLVGCRIPIGQTGFYLTRAEGRLTITADQTVIEIGVTVASEYELVRGDADLRMQFRPWQMDFVGSVTLLYFIKAAEMKATLRSGYFSATFWFKAVIIKGGVSITAWTDDGKFHLAGRGKVTVEIPKGLIVNEWGIKVPPFDIPIAEVGAEFGEFTYGRGKTAWGVKGWVKYWKFKVAAYVDTKGHISCCGGEKKYKLVTPSQLARIRALKEGVALGALTPPATERAELAQYTFAQNQVLINQTVPYETQVMFILSRPVSETVPVLSLQDPQGRTITPDFQPADVFYTEEEVQPDPEDGPEATPSIMMVYVIPKAQPGDWTAILDGISGEPGDGDYVFTVIGSMQPPTLTDPMVVNTGPTSAHAEWNLTALEITPTLDIYVTPGPITTTLTFTNTEGELVTQEEPLFSGFPVAEDVATSYDGSRSAVDLDLSRLESGTYWVWFRAEDWRFPPTQVYAPAPIVVTHEWQDTWTAGLAATSDITFTGEITTDIPTNLGYRALLVSWNDHPNPDVDTYRLRIGTQPDVMEQTIEVGDLRSVYLQSLTPGQIYYLTVEAVDEDSGRISLSEQISAFAEGMNYTLTADRTEIELIAGQSADLNLTLSVNADPAPESVFFTPVTLPDGVGLTLPDTPITPTVAGVTIPVTLDTTDTMPEGVYQVPIVTMGGGVRRELTLQLTVHEPRVFVSASPETVVLGEEETQAVTLSAVGTYGKNTPVTLSLENLPAGLIYDLSQASIRPGETATMTLRDTWLLEPGDYSLQVRVGDGPIVTRVPITLTVAKPHFDLTADLTSLSIIAGERAVFPVQVTGVNLSAPLQLALGEWSTPVESGRAGLAITPNSMPTTTLTLAPDDAGQIDRTIYLIVETAEETPPGTYVQHIQGTGTLRTRNLNLEVVVYEFGTQVADLGITQQTFPAPAPIGGLLTYTLQVSNQGPAAAYNVTLTDTLPTYATLVSATPEQGTCTAVDRTVTCNLRALRRGGLTSVTLVTRLNPGLRVGQELANTAEVQSDQSDPAPGNNSSTTTVLVEAVSDLQVTVWSEPRPATSPGVIAGTEAVYHIAVANLGPSYAYAVQLTSALPEGTTYVSHDVQQGECSPAGNAFWCTVGTLRPGQTAQLELVVAVDPSQRGTLEYTVSVHSQEQDPHPDNNTASVAMPVVANVDIAVGHHAVAPEPVVAGADLTYQLVVTNTGTSDALNVVLTDTLPASVTVRSVTAGQGSCEVQSSTVTCRLGTLPSQHAASINLNLQVNPAVRQPIHNFAVVGTSDADVNPANNSTSHSASPVAGADMVVSLTSMPGVAVAGTTLVYLASARNLGPSDATDAEITITLPSSVTVQTITPMQGTCDQTGQVVTCRLGNVQAGASVPVNIITTVDSNFLGTLEASAGTRGEETDLTPDNNNKTLALPVNAHADLNITLAGTEQIEGDQFEYMVAAYTYTVANAGPSIATGVVVTSTLAEGAIFGYATGAECESTDTRTAICRLDPLMSGQTRTFTLYALLEPGLSGPVKHTAIVGSDAYDPDPTNNSAGFNAMVKYYLYIPMVIYNEDGEPDQR